MGWGLDDAWEGATDLAGDAVDAFEDGVNEIIEAAEDVADAIILVVETVVETGEDLAVALAAAAEKFLAELGEAIEKLADVVVAAAEAVVHTLGQFGEALAKGIDDLVDAVVSVAEWIIEKVGDLAEWVVNEAIPFVYAVLKLAVIFAVLVYTAPYWLLAMFICTQIANVYGAEYGTVLRAITDGYPRYREMYRVRRLTAGGRYLIVSDLHRYPAGDLDIPTQQDDVRLYEGVLQHYAGGDWSLIENGDVEDFWLRGGSGWGVAYDIAGGFTGPVRDVALEAGLSGLAQLHLSKIVGNPSYQKLYGILRSQFHEKGRYFRTAGNHDDVYRNPEMVRSLGRYFPGIGVDDFIVLDAASGAVGVVAHGHQTDGWNSGACAFLGRLTTSVVSAVNDVLPDSKELGVPGPDSVKLWDGEGGNTLTEVSPLIGVTTATDSLDEPILHEAYRETFGDGGPWLILGHTHAPRIDAWDDDERRHWGRYLNDGAVLFPKMLTAVEWDGTLDPERPTLTLVAWRYGDAPDKLIRAVISRSGESHLRAGNKTEVTFQPV